MISWLLWCLSCFMGPVWGPVVWNVTRFQMGPWMWKLPLVPWVVAWGQVTFEDSCNRHIWRSCHLRPFSVSSVSTFYFSAIFLVRSYEANFCDVNNLQFDSSWYDCACGLHGNNRQLSANNRFDLAKNPPARWHEMHLCFWKVSSRLSCLFMLV